jgi:hypothetical protein
MVIIIIKMALLYKDGSDWLLTNDTWMARRVGDSVGYVSRRARQHPQKKSGFDHVAVGVPLGGCTKNVYYRGLINAPREIR